MPSPAHGDDNILDALAAADEALDAFLPKELAEWDALAARLELVEDIIESDRGTTPQLNDANTKFTRPAKVGRYELLDEIGSGGFGIVFRAYDPKLRRAVALKLPRPELLVSPEYRQRFLREARAAGSLDHPNIVPVFDAAEIGPICYIASACCNGPDLARWLKERNEAVSPEVAAQIVVRLADAVRHTHEHGILHRDIKPSNVLLYPEGEDALRGDGPPLGFTPRLSDFGLARLGEEQTGDLTRSGSPLGSPPYMSPEQALGKSRDIGPATDIYALGAVLYELLTGRPPFRGETNTETLRLVIEADPVAPRALRPGVPRSLETIVLACLQKDAARRYDTAAAFRDDLRRYLSGHPILAKPSPRWHHVARAARRHPLAAALSAMVLLFALGTGATIAWSNAQLRTHTIELEQERDLSDRLHYASQLQLARSARDEGHLGRAQQLLQDFRFYPTAPDRREFAWRYLWGSTTQELRLLAEVDSVVWSEAISRTGHLLILSDNAGGLMAVEVPSGQPLWSVARADAIKTDALSVDPKGRVFCVAYRTPSDGDSGDLTTIEVRDGATGGLRATLPRPQNREVLNLRIPGDGTSLIVHYAQTKLDPAQAVEVWNIAQDGGPLSPQLLKERSGLGSIQFAPDGLSFAGRDSDGTAVVFDSLALDRRVALADVSPDIHWELWFSPDGARVAAGDRSNGTVVVWNTATGKRLHRIVGFPSPVRRIELGQGGHALLAVDRQESVHVVDLDTQARTVVYPPSANLAHVHTERLGFTRSESAFLVTRSSYLKPDVIELRDTASGRLLDTCPDLPLGYCKVWEILDGDSKAPALVFSMGRSVWLWHFRASGKESGEPNLSHSDEAWALAFDPSGSLLATGSNDSTELKTIRIWDAQTGALVRGWKGHLATVTALAFSPDGQTLASSSLDSDADVRLWNPATGAEIATLAWPSNGARGVAYSPDGRFLAAAGNDGSVQVWDAVTRQRVLHIRAHRDDAHLLAFSPDGQTLATVSNDQFVRLWEIPSGRPKGAHREPGELFAVAYSPDGTTLAVAGRSRLITVLDAATLSPRRRIRTEDAEIRDVAFSPDGLTLATGGKGRTVRLWDPVTGQQLLPLSGPIDQVNDLAFSPDGKILGACDHTGRVWLFRARDSALPGAP
jgi:WD40 repeat protein/serine/threonine protein kinase